jgi:hypothetical protein
VAGVTPLPSGQTDYDVVPLNGLSVWRVSGARLRPPAQGFEAAKIDAVLASFARERRLPFRLTLPGPAYTKLLKAGVISVEGHSLAFEAYKLPSVPSAAVNFDRILGLYWAGPK